MKYFRNKMIEKFISALIEKAEAGAHKDMDPVLKEALRAEARSFFMDIPEEHYSRDIREDETPESKTTSEIYAENKIVNSLARDNRHSPIFRVNVDPILFQAQNSAMFTLVLDPKSIWKQYGTL